MPSENKLLGKYPYNIILFVKKIKLSGKYVNMDTRTFNPKSLINSACKTRREYLPVKEGWLLFKPLKLNSRNKEVLDKIQKVESVFIHIRRGDYYSPRYIKKLGGTCPIEYYEKAIQLIQTKVKYAVYFVFSDDILWAKKNIQIDDVTFIDWNIDEDSYIDMYLMSECKYGIIANSTFSFWGAMLGRKKRIVCFPKKWVNPPYTSPDICPSNWISF